MGKELCGKVIASRENRSSNILKQEHAWPTQKTHEDQWLEQSKERVGDKVRGCGWVVQIMQGFGCH